MSFSEKMLQIKIDINENSVHIDNLAIGIWKYFFNVLNENVMN